jgi:hypothetical protein
MSKSKKVSESSKHKTTPNSSKNNNNKNHPKVLKTPKISFTLLPYHLTPNNISSVMLMVEKTDAERLGKIRGKPFKT